MIKYYHWFESSLCKIILVGDEKGLSTLHLDTGFGKSKDFVILPDWIENSKIFKDVEIQIKEYLAGKRKTFKLKLNPDGTKFQKKVWKELINIPFGSLSTYKDIAAATGNPKASRAVGYANSKNPIPIIIPCHRVIGTNGKLTGFAHGLEIKDKLISLEKVV